MATKFCDELKLEELNFCHASGLTELASDKFLMRWIGTGSVWSAEKVNNLIQVYRDNMLEDRSEDEYFYYVLLKNDNVIGMIYFRHMHYGPEDKRKDNPFVLTIFINRNEQNKGYGTWGLRQALQKFWSYRPGEKVYADIKSFNKKMNMFLTKLPESQYVEAFSIKKHGFFNRFLLSPE